ncbi:MAG: galactokinase, partial [Erysipelotrichaceae bacterium]|nr:galactokinase [Erysipelotrichaceae bacterium]
VLIGTIFNELYGCGCTPELIAQIGQYAENNYFGKPCGLMDQTASTCGNIITIDFKDPSKPIIKPVNFDFATSGYALCIIDTGANHADLTDDYAGITIEMKQIASHFNKEVLRDVDESDFYDRLKELRESYGDRACLRAIHFFNEQRRVAGQVKALEENDFAAFLDLIKESGRSSWMMLQNVIPAGSIQHQNVAFALALVEKLLSGKGAFRVHGGGFAGTIQAFVPNDIVDTFVKEVDKVLGEGSCQIMSIRNTGGGLVEDCHL